jgi:superfamily II DNA or RNA helicase
VNIFRKRGAAHTVAESPSLLFRDLRRSPEIKFLWEHQGKLLEEYHKKHLNTPNVALELPTGSGKTLVGLLIAEYRRQISNARVVYLCPTRQLCNQGVIPIIVVMLKIHKPPIRSPRLEMILYLESSNNNPQE